MGAYLQRLGPAVGLIACIAFLSLAAWLAGSYLADVMTEALIYMVMTIGISIFMSNSGIVSFGHISFAMIGAYASAWQTCCSGMRGIFMPGLPEALLNTNVPVVLAALIAAGIAALVALVSGAAIMRLNGAAASIALLSLLFVVKTVYENWDSVTAGQSSIVGLPLYVSLWAALAWAAFAILVAHIYNISRFGLQLRATREDESASKASGVNVWGQRVLSFVISAFVTAIGGLLYGHYLGTIAVSVYWLDMTFVTLAMVVVGGMRSLTGAVVGALVVTGVRQALIALERGIDVGDTTLSLPGGTQEVVLAIILLLILTFRPQGIVGDAEMPFFRWRRRKSE